MNLDFLKSLYKYTVNIFNKLKELNSNIYVLRIDEIKEDKHGNTELMISFSGKFNCMMMRPADIINNHETLRCFSPLDIKEIVQLAMYDEQKHDYEIISQSFSYDDANHFFTIKNLKTSEIFKIDTLTLYENDDLLRHFMLQDILSISHSFHHIQYDQASLAIKESYLNRRKENLKVINFNK